MAIKKRWMTIEFYKIWYWFRLLSFLYFDTLWNYGVFNKYEYTHSKAEQRVKEQAYSEPIWQLDVALQYIQ